MQAMATGTGMGMGVRRSNYIPFRVNLKVPASDSGRTPVTQAYDRLVAALRPRGPGNGDVRGGHQREAGQVAERVPVRPGGEDDDGKNLDSERLTRCLAQLLGTSVRLYLILIFIYLFIYCYSQCVLYF